MNIKEKIKIKIILDNVLLPLRLILVISIICVFISMFYANNVNYFALSMLIAVISGLISIIIDEEKEITKYNISEIVYFIKSAHEYR